MPRIPQKSGARGSLKWIQDAINQPSPRLIDELIAQEIGSQCNITWRSPLVHDDFAEYRDASFLGVIGAPHLAAMLAEFWPPQGPQWDALATTDEGDVILVEAKAHIREMFSGPCAAGARSREMIEMALRETAAFVGAVPRAPWTLAFYQLANRISHLHFLRKHGIQAWLVLVGFVGDEDIGGPQSAEEWRAAYEVMWHVLGVPKRHPLSRFIVHVFPDVRRSAC